MCSWLGTNPHGPHDEAGCAGRCWSACAGGRTGERRSGCPGSPAQSCSCTSTPRCRLSARSQPSHHRTAAACKRWINCAAQQAGRARALLHSDKDSEATSPPASNAHQTSRSKRTWAQQYVTRTWLPRHSDGRTHLLFRESRGCRLVRLEPARINQPAWANVAASSAPALSSCGAEALKPCAGVHGSVCI